MSEQEKKNRLWTIPNLLSMLRIALTIPISILLFWQTPTGYFIAFILIVIAYITDWLDGWIARATHSESEYGKVLDPLGDKCIAVFTSGILCFQGKLPIYFFAILFMRDFLIGIVGTIAIVQKKMVYSPSLLGKLNTVFLSILLPFYPLKYVIAPDKWNTVGFLILDNFLIYGTILACALIIISGSGYAIGLIRERMEKNK